MFAMNNKFYKVHINILLASILLAACTIKDLSLDKKQVTKKSYQTIVSEELDFQDDNTYVCEQKISQEKDIDQRFYQNVSVATTSSVNISEIIYKAAHDAHINAILESGIEENITFVATNSPFIDLIKDICNVCNLRYKISDKSIYIQRDTPYLKNYDLQFLNTSRNTVSNISTSMDITPHSTDQANQSLNSTENGSSTSITTNTKSDFWTELENCLKMIIGKEDQNISIHRHAGIITVCATEKQHLIIKNYLDMLSNNINLQVLIEAKILEVRLNDEYKSGINWNLLFNNLQISSPNFESATTNSGNFSFSTSSKHFRSIASFVENFGAVKTLSCPRITVMNNQTALIKIAQNEVIYAPELHRQFSTVTDSRNYDTLISNIQTIPIGFVMSVHPVIDKETGEIILNLRPTISRIARNKKIPVTIYMDNSYQQTSDDQISKTPTTHMQEIPIVDVREMDSILKVRSGQIIVMGGLMQEISKNGSSGLPLHENFGIINTLASDQDNQTEVTELVIFLRAKIVTAQPKIHQADKRFYSKFANDPRPLNLK